MAGGTPKAGQPVNQDVAIFQRHSSPALFFRAAHLGPLGPALAQAVDGLEAGEQFESK